MARLRQVLIYTFVYPYLFPYYPIQYGVEHPPIHIYAMSKWIERLFDHTEALIIWVFSCDSVKANTSFFPVNEIEKILRERGNKNNSWNLYSQGSVKVNHWQNAVKRKRGCVEKQGAGKHTSMWARRRPFRGRQLVVSSAFLAKSITRFLSGREKSQRAAASYFSMRLYPWFSELAARSISRTSAPLNNGCQRLANESAVLWAKKAPHHAKWSPQCLLRF